MVFIRFCIVVLASLSSIDTVFGQLPRGSAEPDYRIPLNEAGQSDVCVHGDRLFLTTHKRLTGPLQNGFYFSSDIVGQCFDKTNGQLLWQVDLPGSYAGRVLESWHDGTSLAPIADAQHVVFHNLNGRLACLSHGGELLWQRAWQAPDPDIKNCRMFLSDDQLIVALPSDKIAVAASEQHPELPFYQLHAFDIHSGEPHWVSPVRLHHATQYCLEQWNDQAVIAASMIDLSHWQFGLEREGFLISVRDGQPICRFPLPPAIPHQKNQLCQGKFLVTSATGGKATAFQMVAPENGRMTREFRIDLPNRYFQWNGTQYEVAEFKPLFTEDRTLRGKGQPTPSTVHVVGNRIYFWRYDTSAVGCLDVESGQSTFVQVPLQVRSDGTAWLKSEFRFSDGIQNSRGQVVNARVDTVRGIERGGFGHTNPAWPILQNGTLYWLNGAGLMYLIDTNIPFGPEALGWLSIDPKGNSWTYGSPAIDDRGIYVRSQRELIRLRIHWK